MQQYTEITRYIVTLSVPKLLVTEEREINDTCTVFPLLVHWEMTSLQNRCS
jgi:hypothetical protein